MSADETSSSPTGAATDLDGDTPIVDWQAVHDRLNALPPEQLTADDLDALASALFWLNQPWRSVELRRLAYERWAADGEGDRAARAAWQVFYEHWLIGEEAVAQGWLARARNLITEPASAVAGWVAVAEADVATTGARDAAGLDTALDAALDHARRAVTAGRRFGDPDLLAMGLQAEGRALLATGDTEAGLACFDEAMVAVIGNELQPLYTGWVYCTVISTCHTIGDLRRANEWSQAALRWCTHLRNGLLYPGLCRVYAAELAHLRGDWSNAESQARQACEDLLAYDRRYAGAAHYLVGDLCRLQGRLDEATEFYHRAHELGHDPQPGLALLAAVRGRIDDGLEALRAGLGRPGPPLPRLQFLLALVELADQVDDGALASAAAAEAATVAPHDDQIAGALALAVQGRAAATVGEPDQAVRLLRQAVMRLAELDVPHEAARLRLALARLADAAGDRLTAELERSSAVATLERLGADPDIVAAAPVAAAVASASTPLSARELDVLRLVAEGLTNRAVADELHLSPHTVARHLANIFTKLDVPTRTAAVSTATAAGLLPR
ncbi:MAG: helix-turn-helix transcriptional regulator [Actinomycetota bacterium]